MEVGNRWTGVKPTGIKEYTTFPVGDFQIKPFVVFVQACDTDHNFRQNLNTKYKLNTLTW